MAPRCSVSASSGERPARTSARTAYSLVGARSATTSSPTPCNIPATPASYRAVLVPTSWPAMSATSRECALKRAIQSSGRSGLRREDPEGLGDRGQVAEHFNAQVGDGLAEVVDDGPNSEERRVDELEDFGGHGHVAADDARHLAQRGLLAGQRRVEGDQVGRQARQVPDFADHATQSLVVQQCLQLCGALDRADERLWLAGLLEALVGHWEDAHPPAGLPWSSSAIRTVSGQRSLVRLRKLRRPSRRTRADDDSIERLRAEDGATSGGVGREHRLPARGPSGASLAEALHGWGVAVQEEDRDHCPIVGTKGCLAERCETLPGRLLPPRGRPGGAVASPVAGSAGGRPGCGPVLSLRRLEQVDERCVADEPSWGWYRGLSAAVGNLSKPGRVTSARGHSQGARHGDRVRDHRARRRRAQPDRGVVHADQRLRGLAGTAHRVGFPGRVAGTGRQRLREGRCRCAPEVETHLVNAVLTNGARYYVDHAHPEYSGAGVLERLGGGPLRQGWRGDPGPFGRGGRAAAARPASTSAFTRTTPTARATRTGPTRTT